MTTTGFLRPHLAFCSLAQRRLISGHAPALQRCLVGPAALTPVPSGTLGAGTSLALPSGSSSPRLPSACTFLLQQLRVGRRASPGTGIVLAEETPAVPRAGACWSGSQPRCKIHSALAATVTHSLSHRHHILPAARAHPELGRLGLSSAPPGTGFGGKAQSLQPLFEDGFSPPILYPLREMSRAALTAAGAAAGFLVPQLPQRMQTRDTRCPSLCSWIRPAG